LSHLRAVSAWRRRRDSDLRHIGPLTRSGALPSRSRGFGVEGGMLIPASPMTSPSRAMRVSHLSTFWPNHGHTHYTDNLIRGMRTHEPERHFVLAERGATPAETEAYACIPCF